MTEQEKKELLGQMAEADKAYEEALANEEKNESNTLHVGKKHGRKAKIYIAGRVTGVKPEVYEKQFATVKMELEKAGHEVINPLVDIPHEDKDNWGLTVMECLPYVAQCDCIAMLPGWERSHGAQMEYHFAVGNGMQVLQVTPVGKGNSRQKRKTRNRK